MHQAHYRAVHDGDPSASTLARARCRMRTPEVYAPNIMPNDAGVVAKGRTERHLGNVSDTEWVVGGRPVAHHGTGERSRSGVLHRGDRAVKNAGSLRARPRLVWRS